MLVDWMMAVLRFAAVASVCPRIVSRDDWGAKLPHKVTEMRNPVSTVVIHHTYQPAYCATAEECEQAMRSMQDFHQGKGWDDIGYSFAIGGEGRVYKGRGWNRVGAHAPPYNFDSIGITLIGDWREEAPPTAMLDAAQWLIKCGVQMGHIAPNYQLIGHLQALANHTECPGGALLNVIKTWEHWTDEPAPPAVRPVDDVPVTSAPAPSPAMVPVMAEGTYNPANPSAEKDAVEVRQLNKRSLWDRLVQIWQKEALRREALEAAEQQSSS